MQSLEIKRKELVDFFLKKGILINNNLLKELDDKKKLSDFLHIIESSSPKDMIVLSEKIKGIVSNKQHTKLNWYEPEKQKTNF